MRWSWHTKSATLARLVKAASGLHAGLHVGAVCKQQRCAGIALQGTLGNLRPE
jgi:hypothetical protein